MQGPGYWAVTNEFHGSVEALGGNRVLELLTRIVGSIWHEHVVTHMDTHAVRDQILQEHRDIAKAIIARQPSKAGEADARPLRRAPGGVHPALARALRRADRVGLS